MRQRQILLYVAAYLLVGAVAVMSVSAQKINSPLARSQADETTEASGATDATGEASGTTESPAASEGADAPGVAGGQAPDGSAEQISDWALAGVVWSDASLAKKVATEALRSKRAASATENEIKELKQVVADTAQVIEALEQFGWKQTGPRGLPNDPVGEDAPERPVGETTPPQEIVDLETPVGGDDPGVDDEIDNPDVEIDIEQYRVDDVVDETPQEAANRADALEDGTEQAIAAAAGRRTIQGPVAGRVSRREVTTRSATLPYSVDSIYDRDDFDPDIDYDVENPSGVLATNEQSIDRGDPDDDIDQGDDLQVADGEDELIKRMAKKPPVDEPRTPSGTISSAITRYSADVPKHQRDADWVQLHLDANQLMWDQINGEEDLTESAMDTLRKLRSTAGVAYRSTSNPQLRTILQPVLKMRVETAARGGSNAE